MLRIKIGCFAAMLLAVALPLHSAEIEWVWDEAAAARSADGTSTGGCVGAFETPGKVDVTSGALAEFRSFSVTWVLLSGLNLDARGLGMSIMFR